MKKYPNYWCSHLGLLKLKYLQVVSCSSLLGLVLVEAVKVEVHALKSPTFLPLITNHLFFCKKEVNSITFTLFS